MESFTDGTLIYLALDGDREAITEVCQLIADRLKNKDGRILEGFSRIGQGCDPNSAFSWQDRGCRDELSHICRATKEEILLSDLFKDLDLYDYTVKALKSMAACSPPNRAFGWDQKNRGGRTKNCNALRDWDIRMTFYNLRRKGYKREDVIEVIYELVILRKSRIEEIVKSVTVDVEPDFPEDIFPLPVDELIKQKDIDNALLKVLKRNK